jgi:hypothetical protein
MLHRGLSRLGEGLIGPLDGKSQPYLPHHGLLVLTDRELCPLKRENICMSIGEGVIAE